MIGTENQYIIYDDGTFNCPLCGLVHWPKDYKYKIDQYGYGVEFEFRCLNKQQCRTRLMVVINGDIAKVTTKAWDEAFKRNMKPKRDYNNHNNKTVFTMKKIKVASHAKRYADVETSDKLELIEALKALVENDRKAEIETMEDRLKKLKSGQFPVREKPAATEVSNVEFEPESNQQVELIVEEPTNQTETTQEEALDNL
jgi:hypothetical protein